MYLSQLGVVVSVSSHGVIPAAEGLEMHPSLDGFHESRTLLAREFEEFIPLVQPAFPQDLLLFIEGDSSAAVIPCALRSLENLAFCCFPFVGEAPTHGQVATITTRVRLVVHDPIADLGKTTIIFPHERT